MMMLTMVLMMVTMIVVMMVVTVVTSTLYISHKWLIVVGWREASKTSVLDDDGVDDGDDDGVDNGAEGADKHLVHLPQVADCCRTDKNEQNKHLVSNKNNDVDDGVDDGDYDSVGNGDDDGIDDGAEGADTHLVHLSQMADCRRIERNKQNEH
eukprot:15350105-Ditylum_brightwellii.AAC.1